MMHCSAIYPMAVRGVWGGILLVALAGSGCGRRGIPNVDPATVNAPLLGPDGSAPVARWVLGAHTTAVTRLVFSPDDRLLVSAGRNDLTVRLWNTADGSQAGSIPLAHRIGDIVVTPDSAQILVTDLHGTLVLCDADAHPGDPVRASYTNMGAFMALSPGGNLLATTFHKKPVRIWSYPDLRFLRQLEHPTGYCQSRLMFTSDGQRLVTACATPRLAVWDTASWHGTVRDIADFPEKGTVYFDLNPAGTLGFAAHGEGHVASIDLSDGRVRWRRVMPSSATEAIRCDASGRLTACGAGEKIALLDAETGGYVTGMVSHSGVTITALAVSHDGRTLASGSREGQVVIWRNGSPLEPETPPSAVAAIPAPRPTGNLLQNPGADQGTDGWLPYGEAGTETLEAWGPCFVLRKGGSLSQVVTLPEDSEGQSLLIMAAARYDNPLLPDSTAGRPGVPYLYGQWIARDGMNRVLADLSDASLWLSGVKSGAWGVVSAVLTVPPRAGSVRILMRQSANANVRDPGTARIDDLNVQVLSSPDSAARLIQKFRDTLPSASAPVAAASKTRPAATPPPAATSEVTAPRVPTVTAWPPEGPVTLPLQFMRRDETGAGYYPRGSAQATLTNVPPPEIRAWPALGGAHPLYGTVRLGDGNVAFVYDTTDPTSRFYDRFRIDANANNDLSDDAPLRGEVCPRAPSESVWVTFKAVDVALNVDGHPTQYTLEPRAYCRSTNTYQTQPFTDQLTSDNVSANFYTACYRQADADLGGVPYRIILVDAAMNGRFGDTPELDEKYDDLPGWKNNLVSPRGDRLVVARRDAPRERLEDQVMPHVLLLQGCPLRIHVDPVAGTLELTPVNGPQGFLRLPDSVKVVCLQSGTNLLAAIDPPNRLRLPAGPYRLVSYELKRLDAWGAPWTLSAGACWGRAVVEVGGATEPRMAMGEPFAPTIQTYEYEVQRFKESPAGGLPIGFRLTGAGGERVSAVSCGAGAGKTKHPLSKRNALYPLEPSFTVTDPAGAEVARGGFEYG